MIAAVGILQPEQVVVGNAGSRDADDILFQQLFNLVVGLGVAWMLRLEAGRARQRLAFAEDRFVKNGL